MAVLSKLTAPAMRVRTADTTSCGQFIFGARFNSWTDGGRRMGTCPPRSIFRSTSC